MSSGAQDALGRRRAACVTLWMLTDEVLGVLAGKVDQWPASICTTGCNRGLRNTSDANLSYATPVTRNQKTIEFATYSSSYMCRTRVKDSQKVGFRPVHLM